MQDKVNAPPKVGCVQHDCAACQRREKWANDPRDVGQLATDFAAVHDGTSDRYIARTSWHCGYLYARNSITPDDTAELIALLREARRRVYKLGDKPLGDAIDAVLAKHDAAIGKES